MQCPKCGGDLKSKTTVHTKLTIERYRKCVNCEAKFYTKEVFVPDRTRLREVDLLKVNNGTAEDYVFEDDKFEDSITANDYQRKALRTANRRIVPRQQLANGLMGLNGEAGEAIDILKKHLYQGHELDEEHMAKELGDVAWYLAISAHALGYDLGRIFEMNIAKLKERYPEKFDPELSINRKAGDI